MGLEEYYMDNVVSPETNRQLLAGLWLQWESLREDQKAHSFGEGEINEEGFIKAVRDTYYYFKNCLEGRRNKEDYDLTMLTIREIELISQIFAYSEQIICTESEISTKCEIMQLIAAGIYDSITLFPDAPILKCEGILDNGEEAVFEYDVDKGNLQEIFDLFANR